MTGSRRGLFVSAARSLRKTATMKRFPDLFSPDRRPDLTLPSMIFAVGLLLAWAKSNAREQGLLNLRAPLFPVEMNPFRSD